MALSKTHILAFALSLYRENRDDLKLEEMIPLVVLPDAIRCFNYGDGVKNNRVITHFEVNPSTGKPSGIRYPSIPELKTLDDEKIRNLSMHIEPDYNQVAIGDQTSLHAFYDWNSDMDYIEFYGIAVHLKQDCIYDEYIRKKIDCSRRPEGIFVFKGETYDAKSVRKLIGEIEEQEFRILAKKFEDETGIRPDMKWFEENVKTALDSAYCPKMAETTWKYISVDLTSSIPKHLTDDECNNIVERLINLT